jgi:hypothetical protein
MSEKSTESLSILQRIKQLFADTLPTSYKLADGTDVTISLLDVGGDFLIGTDPAAEGTYTLMDGTSVAVDSAGKITSVTDPSEFAATDYKLSGGDTISVDKLEVGGKVTKGDAPVAEGDWTLEDGTTFSTDANGVITVLVAPKADDTQGCAKMTKEQVQAYADAMVGDTGDQMSKMVTCIKALMEWCFGEELQETPEQTSAEAEAEKLKDDAIAIYKQGLAKAELKLSKQEATIARQGETITQILELMTQLAEAPAGDPPVQRKSIFSGEIPQGKKGAIARYADAAQKLNDQNIKN